MSGNGEATPQEKAQVMEMNRAAEQVRSICPPGMDYVLILTARQNKSRFVSLSSTVPGETVKVLREALEIALEGEGEPDETIDNRSVE